MSANKISWHLGWQIEIMIGKEVKKCESLTSMRTIIDERKPNDRYDVRSRYCHATDAQMRYEYMKALQRN